MNVVDIDGFLRMKLPTREYILGPWLPEQGVVMLYGLRGCGKTHSALNIAVAVASGTGFLRWHAPKPRPVLYLDGEMPAVVLQERLIKIVASKGLSQVLPLRIITPDLQGQKMPALSTLAGQRAIEPYLNGVELVIVDNISTLCGGRENIADAWIPVQEWALSLRQAAISLVFIHHAGKQGGQRGTSKREDILDSVICLRRPDDYQAVQGARFEVHYEKCRHTHGDDIRPFEAWLTALPDGKEEWVVTDIE